MPLNHAYGFLDRINIQHGPDALLTRFFVAAVQEAASVGIELDFGTFDELMEVNRLNAKTWMPITTTFRPCLGGANSDNGLVVFGRDASGSVVTTQAVRLFDWRDSNFRIETEALRLFYANPDRDKAPNERCRVLAVDAEQVAGRVAYIGGLWFRPDLRGNPHTKFITRVGRACALAFWGIDHLCGIITPTNLGTKFHARHGYRDVTPKSVIMSQSPSKPGGDLEMSLCRATPMQIVDDIFMLLNGLEAQVDVRIGHRYAQ